MNSALDKKIAATLTLLEKAVQEFSPVTFANSLGAEDMVLTDLIAKYQPNIDMFSLDTGRLPEETYALMQKVRTHYEAPLILYYPDAGDLEVYVAEHGVNGFYTSVQNRKDCCHVRKVRPLKRALVGAQAWITGMRREQAVTRGHLEEISYDTDNGLWKLNPLLEWSNDDVWSYIKENQVPYSALHDKSYPSIGCAPCTRAVEPGEDVRAGRWWWEDPQHKECGLHVGKSMPLTISRAD